MARKQDKKTFKKKISGRSGTKKVREARESPFRRKEGGEVRKRKFDGSLYFERKRRAVKVKGGRCERCGDDDPVVLHFHHHGKKRFSLSHVFGDPDVSWAEIQRELSQTSLLCANDHARHHALERKEAWERKKSRA